MNKFTDGYINELEKLCIEEAINNIKRKRNENLKNFLINQEHALRLVKTDQLQQANEIMNYDILSFYHIYTLAEKAEKEGNINKAIDLYWYNIYCNGTDAPANFSRLMILLRKNNYLNFELKIVRIYMYFAKTNEKEKISKRIINIEKLISKKTIS